MADFLRLSTLLLAALLAGCTGGTPPAAPLEVPVEEAAIEEEPEGVTTTLTRVVPRNYEIDWSAYQAMGPCPIDDAAGCSDPLIQIDNVVIGTAYDTPQWAVNDADALFWRLDAVVEWTTDNPIIQEATLDVFTRKWCGVGCWEERPIDSITGQSPIVFERRDIFLEAGETGLLLRLTTPPETATPLGVQFTTTGNADGYVPAGDPPIVIEG